MVEILPRKMVIWKTLTEVHHSDHEFTPTETQCGLSELNWSLLGKNHTRLRKMDVVSFLQGVVVPKEYSGIPFRHHQAETHGGTLPPLLIFDLVCVFARLTEHYRISPGWWSGT